MNDQRTSTDFLKLKEQVMSQEARMDVLERTIEALSDLAKANDKVSKQIQHALFGSPDGQIVGCQERQRDQGKFQAAMKRLAWAVAIPVIALSIGGIVATLKHVLSE